MTDTTATPGQAPAPTGPTVRPKKATSNLRVLVLAHLGWGIVVWYVFSEGLALLWATMGWPSPKILDLARPPMAIAVGLGALSIAIVAINSKVQKYANEVINELRKVTWPEFKETRQTTLVVLATTAIIAAILGGWDFIFSKLIKALLELPTS